MCRMRSLINPWPHPFPNTLPNGGTVEDAVTLSHSAAHDRAVAGTHEGAVRIPVYREELRTAGIDSVVQPMQFKGWLHFTDLGLQCCQLCSVFKHRHTL